MMVVALIVCALSSDALTPTMTLSRTTSESRQKAADDSDFEQAVEIIKKYETLHSIDKWPYVGYGHRVKKGEKIPRRKLSEKEADALLRKDLRQNMELFKGYGQDQLLLAVLAYSVGPYKLLGTLKSKRSPLLNKLDSGNRNIRSEYIAYSKYRGRPHKMLKTRRTEEFNALYRTTIPTGGNT